MEKAFRKGRLETFFQEWKIIMSMDLFLSLLRDRSTEKDGRLHALDLSHPGKEHCSVHGYFHQPIGIWPFQNSLLNFQNLSQIHLALWYFRAVLTC